MVGRLIILFLILGAVAAYFLARFVLLPMWRRTIEACRERDRALAEREESLQREEEDRQRAEKELESLLGAPEEHVDVAAGQRGTD